MSDPRDQAERLDEEAVDSSDDRTGDDPMNPHPQGSPGREPTPERKPEGEPSSGRDPDSPGAAIDDRSGDVPEPNEPA